jgi:GT2 family glycosyltransferase
MLAEPKPDHPVIVGVQSLLYRTPHASLHRMLEALDNSVELGKAEGACQGIVVVLGDGSPRRLLDDSQTAELVERYAHIDEIRYHWFAENVGTSRGHNEMFGLMPDHVELVVTSNPDVIADARALWRMAAMFDDPQVGMVEAKQLPIEHPKEYDVSTGQTSWATTAFAMTRAELFRELGGFDQQTFFMYCDDVDYSWRVREAGYDVIFQPAAVVFHDKHLTVEGRWMPTGAEVQYSAEAAVLLAHKWSNDSLVEQIMRQFEMSTLPAQKAAAEEFRRRETAGQLVPQRDPDHRIATFVGYHYAEHRYSL